MKQKLTNLNLLLLNLLLQLKTAADGVF